MTHTTSLLTSGPRPTLPGIQRKFELCVQRERADWTSDQKETWRENEREKTRDREIERRKKEKERHVSSDEDEDEKRQKWRWKETEMKVKREREMKMKRDRERWRWKETEMRMERDREMKMWRDRDEERERKKEDRVVKNEECKAVTVVFLCGPNVFELISSVRVFSKNYYLQIVFELFDTNISIISGRMVFSRIHIDWHSHTDSERSERSTNESRTGWGKSYIHVDVQWHWLDKEWKFWCLYLEFRTSEWLRKEVSARTLVFFWSWGGMKRVWNVQLQTRRKVGPTSQSDDWAVPAKWSSRFPRHQCAQPRNIETKMRKKHYSLHSGLRDCWVHATHHALSKSAQYQRSSTELVRHLVEWTDPVQKND